MKWSLQSHNPMYPPGGCNQRGSSSADPAVTLRAQDFDRDGHFDVINSAKGGKYAKSSQLAKLAENKGFRYSGALLMQIVSSHFIVVPIAT